MDLSWGFELVSRCYRCSRAAVGFVFGGVLAVFVVRFGEWFVLFGVVVSCFCVVGLIWLGFCFRLPGWVIEVGGVLFFAFIWLGGVWSAQRYFSLACV